MARFTVEALSPPPPPAGIHVCRIISAKERTSQTGNPILAMRIRFPNGEELSPIITFAESTQKIIGYFARSANLVLPGTGSECEITPEDVLGRYLFVEISYDEDGTPRVARYLSREIALSLNPALAQVRLQPQEPRILGRVTESEGML